MRRVALEKTMRAGTAGVDDALGDTLVVEVRDLLAQDEVFEERRAAQAGLQRILVVRDLDALIRGKGLPARVDADAIERACRPVDAGDRLLADFVGDRALAQCAAGDGGVTRVRCLVRRGAGRGLTLLWGA